MENESITRWDAVAQDWARFAETNDYRNFFLIPETFKLLGKVAGKRVLDLGCGEGGYARRLAKRGAEITVVDASREMIAIAEERAQREGLAITHCVRDAAALDGLADGSFEIVVAAMSLLLDGERYARASAEVWRVLKPGGGCSRPFFTRASPHRVLTGSLTRVSLGILLSKTIATRHPGCNLSVVVNSACGRFFITCPYKTISTHLPCLAFGC